MSWGPTVSALSYVFDKSLEEQIIQRSITGFRYYFLLTFNENWLPKLWHYSTEGNFILL